GLNAVMLVGKPFARASHAALDFVSDQESVVLARQPVRGLGKLPAHRTNPALTLDKFEANGADRGVKLAFKIGYIIELDKLHSGHHRRKRCAIFFLVRGSQSAESSAMEGMLQRQNPPFRFRTRSAVGPRIRTGQLKRSFPGFSAAVGKKGAVHTGNPR